jgi:FkbM family methyltransferase
METLFTPPRCKVTPDDLYAEVAEYFDLGVSGERGATVLDVGANIGAFAVPIGKLVPEGRVIAIEASPSVATILRRNVEQNNLSNICVVQCAASTGNSQTVPFYEAPSDHFGMGSSAPQFNTAPIHVRAQSIDDVLFELSVPEVSVVKVDVEGYEAHVFLGARQLLAGSHPPIIFEFCDWAEERAFPGRRGWAQEILLEHGYALWTVSNFFHGSPPMVQPLRKGCHSIVAVRGETNGLRDSVMSQKERRR